MKEVIPTLVVFVVSVAHMEGLELGRSQRVLYKRK